MSLADFDSPWQTETPVFYSYQQMLCGHLFSAMVFSAREPGLRLGLLLLRGNPPQLRYHSETSATFCIFIISTSLDVVSSVNHYL